MTENSRPATPESREQIMMLVDHVLDGGNYLPSEAAYRIALFVRSEAAAVSETKDFVCLKEPRCKAPCGERNCHVAPVSATPSAPQGQPTMTEAPGCAHCMGCNDPKCPAKFDTDWKRRYEEEFAIVDRCWKALGISRYADAQGKAIDQIIAERCAVSESGKPSYADLKAMFPLLWHINDHLRVTPDQAVEYTGSTNDVDRLRDVLHKLDPDFDLGTGHEGIRDEDFEAAIKAHNESEGGCRG